MVTKFRAFQLDSPGSLFSYWKDNTYTLIEARIPKGGIEVLRADLSAHNKEKIDVLHITSWDDDHCDFDSLVQIMNNFRPGLIETPSYTPSSDTGKLCHDLIHKYDDIHQKFVNNVVQYNYTKIKSLTQAPKLGVNNVVYHSLYDVDNHNDMSQIRLFRSKGFNVLSMGDCESEEITKSMIGCGILAEELDVLILPHHGSENSSLTTDFLKFCKPTISICSSNFDNEYDHPRQSVINMLGQNGVTNYTTKTGDVIIIQETESSMVRLFNYITNNNNLDEVIQFMSKRSS